MENRIRNSLHCTVKPENWPPLYAVRLSKMNFFIMHQIRFFINLAPLLIIFLTGSEKCFTTGGQQKQFSLYWEESQYYSDKKNFETDFPDGYVVCWCNVLHNHFKSILPLQLYTSVSLSITVVENLLGNIWTKCFHCSRLNFLSLRWALETTHFENTFTEYITFLSYTYCNMLQYFCLRFV